MKKQIFTLLAGMVLGMALLSGGYAAASTVLAATPSNQTFYVNGQQVSMTAYLIGGSNYVRLRDIGQAVGFNVYWDGTVQIQGDQPYTGVAPGNAASAPVQQTPTEESVQAAILALKDVYPHMAYYPAPYRPNDPLNRPYSNCDHCAGWAMLCSDAAFGTLPWRRIEQPSWNQIRIGDLVRYSNATSGHVVVVVDKTDEYVKVTESGSTNMVRWGGKYPRWWLEEQPGYAMWTRYPQ